MTEPIVSVAAVTYRNLEQTKAFVDSVLACTKEPFEFIMVNNGSPIDVATYLNSCVEKIPNFNLINNPSNMGIGIAMNQAMRACKTNYIFRCDSDIVIRTSYWTELMRELSDKHPEVGAVGTAITGGKLIDRGKYIESDICLSNCMLIPRRTIETIDRKMKEELPRVRQAITKLILSGTSRYDGYSKHLGGMLNEMIYHGGYWSPNFPYGTDDFHYSMLVRHAGLKIVKSELVQVIHKDESMRPDWSAERHRRVSEGFQYWRTFWEIMLDFDRIESLTWDCWPMNKTYGRE